MPFVHDMNAPAFTRPTSLAPLLESVDLTPDLAHRWIAAASDGYREWGYDHDAAVSLAAAIRSGTYDTAPLRLYFTEHGQLVGGLDVLVAAVMAAAPVPVWALWGCAAPDPKAAPWHYDNDPYWPVGAWGRTGRTAPQ